MKPGDQIHVRACKADGTVYRSWFATIESVTADSIVTIAPAGSSVFNIKGEDYPIRHHYRAYYWFDKFYNLLEIFETSGELIHIYLNIASPPELGNGGMSFKDHELDVSKVFPGQARLVDEEEFAEAIVKYQYSQEFQDKMYEAAGEALKLAENWQARPVPVFPFLSSFIPHPSSFQETSMLKKKIAFIGPGVMAEAMIAGLLRKKLADAKNITASGPREERGGELHKKYGIKVSTDNAFTIHEADVVVLSVKPQRLTEVMKGLKGIRPDGLVLSIIAGATIKKISTGLKHKAIVRSMPNTPGQIGEGITVWTASKEVTEEQQEMTRAILGALGEEVFVEDESYLDMATALSGSGPAYVFLFTEALIDAGVHMGFPRRIAEQLVLQTIKGSASFYEGAGRHPATLRNQVTSPGGTSAEALYYLEKAGFRTAISRAVWAAYQRSLELGKEKPGHIDTDEEK